MARGVRSCMCVFLHHSGHCRERDLGRSSGMCFPLPLGSLTTPFTTWGTHRRDHPRAFSSSGARGRQAFAGDEALGFSTRLGTVAYAAPEVRTRACTRAKGRDRRSSSRRRRRLASSSSSWETPPPPAKKWKENGRTVTHARVGSFHASFARRRRAIRTVRVVVHCGDERITQRQRARGLSPAPRATISRLSLLLSSRDAPPSSPTRFLRARSEQRYALAPNHRTTRSLPNNALAPNRSSTRRRVALLLLLRQTVPPSDEVYDVVSSEILRVCDLRRARRRSATGGRTTASRRTCGHSA
jgi:hypothetical protein